MNASMLPLFASTFLAKRLRGMAEALQDRADRIDARRSLTEAHREVLQSNAPLRDKHKGQTAYVIVNGPSLAEQDIMHLKDAVTFVVSGFWKHDAVLRWQPTYYSLLDRNFFTDTPATRAFYKSLHERIHGSTYFVPLFRGHDAVVSRKILPMDRTHFVATMGWQTPGNDLTHIVQSFAGVSSFALSQAIYMGCNPIYLLGFDHDYLANRGLDRHFYKGGTIQGHQHTNVPLADRIPYDEEMRANTRLWTNYRVLKAAAEHQGIQIFNATRGGYLDVFDRVDYQTLRQPADSAAVAGATAVP